MLKVFKAQPQIMKLKHLLVVALTVAFICPQSLPVKADIETKALAYQTAGMLDDCIKKKSGEPQRKVCVKKFLRPPQVKKNLYATWDYLVLSAYYKTAVSGCKSEYIKDRRELTQEGGMSAKIGLPFAKTLRDLCISSIGDNVLQYAIDVNSPAFDLLSSQLSD